MSVQYGVNGDQELQMEDFIQLIKSTGYNVRAVQLVQTTGLLKWSPSCFLYLNLAKNLEGMPIHKVKLG